MIRSFGDKLTEDIFHGNKTKKAQKYNQIVQIITRNLYIINAANYILDLKTPPSNNLELLKGKLKNYYSIRINSQFRIIFSWIDNNTYDVKIVDYH